MYFENRIDAGKRLANVLAHYRGMTQAIVLALPRGGVPVGFEIARALGLPLDILLVRKLGVPGQEELAMGAIADGGVQVLNEETIRELNIPESAVARVVRAEYAELERRSLAYRQGKPAPSLAGKTVILADDGCATGSNMQAAVQSAIRQKAARVVVAVPVMSESAFTVLHRLANEVVCLGIPIPFFGVGAFYHDFGQTGDAEVQALLKKAEQPCHAS